MIRSAPPAPFKTALITFLVAAVVALLVAQGASARVDPSPATVTTTVLAP